MESMSSHQAQEEEAKNGRLSDYIRTEARGKLRNSGRIDVLHIFKNTDG
jgi:hypothetical protein